MLRSSGIDKDKYFISLETPEKSKSSTMGATSRASLSDAASQSESNLDEFEGGCNSARPTGRGKGKGTFNRHVANKPFPSGLEVKCPQEGFVQFLTIFGTAFLLRRMNLKFHPQLFPEGIQSGQLEKERGGVAQGLEGIHRPMADRRLLAIQASCRRVAATKSELKRKRKVEQLAQLEELQQLLGERVYLPSQDRQEWDIYIFETTIARRFANRRGPILPDEEEPMEENLSRCYIPMNGTQTDLGIRSAWVNSLDRSVSVFRVGGTIGFVFRVPTWKGSQERTRRIDEEVWGQEYEGRSREAVSFEKIGLGSSWEEVSGRDHLSGVGLPKWTIGKRRQRSGPDKHKIHSIAKQESENLHKSCNSFKSTAISKSSMRAWYSADYWNKGEECGSTSPSEVERGLSSILMSSTIKVHLPWWKNFDHKHIFIKSSKNSHSGQRTRKFFSFFFCGGLIKGRFQPGIS
ncbi:hypothetical protein HAX54_003724 [Datura stramonium]|uniref:Uncharacterized protein n=1 Tax=Datura stramonium TaxID=4076 RepID=A0ABS8T6Y2_DATST|nr:hypothetical protein [Datura stramonium]